MKLVKGRKIEYPYLARDLEIVEEIERRSLSEEDIEVFEIDDAEGRVRRVGDLLFVKTTGECLLILYRYSRKFKAEGVDDFLKSWNDQGG